ncbi:unnamed protein product [Durusdinium trenchii]|uniref:Uncharacterized protein n=2 Tax=Durusdinium trenchii TaxID=1381693 RepID=A0ABP0MTN9_9DINO
MATTERTPFMNPDNDLSSLKDTAVRHGFVRKVFGILGVQLFATTIVAGFITIYGDHLVSSNPGLVTTLMVCSIMLVLSVSCVFMCCPDTMRRSPTNYALLSLFTLAEAVLVGFICVQYTVQSILVTLAITAVVTLSLMLFSCQTTYDFTGYMPYMFTATLVLLFLGIGISISAAFGAAGTGAFKVLNMIYAGLGALMFSFYIVLDTQMILGGKHSKFRFSIDDYCMAAINIYMDIVQLFLFLLQLLGERK